jgi:Tfp pilus assembly protein PilO
MKLGDRAIIFGVALAALAIGFYVLALAPKRDQANQLASQIDDLHASISQEQQVAQFAAQARRDFPRYYGRLVVLGKAVPAQADTSSMLVQLNSVSDRSKIRLDSISLTEGGSSDASSTSPATTSPTSPSTTSTPPSSSATTSGSTAAGSTSASTATPASSIPAPATESSAATQPLGAVVGAAGLPTLPYQLGFRGTFFDIADFIGGIDGLVKPQDGGTRVSSNGRLFTIDGFSLQGGAPGSSPKLDASFLVTTFVTPEDQGLTGGASPSGPSPAGPSVPQAQPASAVVPK